MRTLLIHGARAALSGAEKRRKAGHHPLSQLQSWGLEHAAGGYRSRAAVALTSKVARIVWAVWKHGRIFDGNYRTPEALAA